MMPWFSPRLSCMYPTTFPLFVCGAEKYSGLRTSPQFVSRVQTAYKTPCFSAIVYDYRVLRNIQMIDMMKDVRFSKKFMARGLPCRNSPALGGRGKQLGEEVVSAAPSP